ncbi:hypothetical protein [Plantactinospora soyae]|uniref:SH3 domain-containing protein n=1 Tax=Plantactinospora soyae TaxID=1544732 RepID=A0A927M9T5_9ACTN|nr:hypothetical protein [Plantactinospora soyae]MBE1489266.1 hypothetical protein [Plantactinospora soyae]
MRKLLPAAFAVATLLLVTGATTADAATDQPARSSASSTFVNYTWADVDMYNCADSGCTPRIRLRAWQPLDDFCYVVGRYVGTSSYWDYVYDRATGHYGYVPEYYLASSAQGTPC